MRVLGLSGSLRRNSYNRKLLLAAARVLPRQAGFELWTGIADLPVYNEELDGAEPPAAAAQLRATVAGADALLFATPEYNASIPGGLKNLVDWASRPLQETCLRGKPVAVVGASAGFFGAVWAQAELRKVLNACGASVVDRQLPVPRAFEAFTPEGLLVDRALAAALTGIIEELVTMATRDRAGDTSQRQVASALSAKERNDADPLRL